MKKWMKISFRDRFLYGGLACSAVSMIIMIFYKSWIFAVICGTAAFLIYPEFCRRSLYEKKKRILVREFREVLYSLMTALRAGRSLERALVAVWEDMDEAATPLLYKEWQIMLGALQVNAPAESCLKELAHKCGIQEIQSLAEVVEISKKSQGDIVKIIENTVHLLQDKIEIQEEVHVMLAKKRIEQKIINFMPFCILGMLLMISPEYMNPLYESIQGRIIMSICVGMTAGSFWLSHRIADIEI